VQRKEGTKVRNRSCPDRVQVPVMTGESRGARRFSPLTSRERLRASRCLLRLGGNSSESKKRHPERSKRVRLRMLPVGKKKEL